MKTLIILNIGLETIKGNRVQLHHALNEIQRAGLSILTSCVVSGQWEGKEEQTLVVSGLAYDSPELRPRLYSASRALSQHAIACYANGAGELIGDNPQGYQFDLALFHFHPEGKPVNELDVACEAAWNARHLSPCQAVQAKHRAKCEELKIAGYSEPTKILNEELTHSDITSLNCLLAWLQDNADGEFIDIFFHEDKSGKRWDSSHAYPALSKLLKNEGILLPLP